LRNRIPRLSKADALGRVIHKLLDDPEINLTSEENNCFSACRLGTSRGRGRRVAADQPRRPAILHLMAEADLELVNVAQDRRMSSRPRLP
jgi:hypothetical protein